MEKESENQIKERREERKRIKKRNAAKRKAKKKLFVVLRYFAVVFVCALLYLFAFTAYAPIKREEAKVISPIINSAEMKQDVLSGRHGSRTHDYIQLSTSEGEFYFELSNNPYEIIETAELFEELEGKGNVTIIVSGRRPDFHSQWTHAGNDEAIEVSDGEQVFGSLEEYNDTLKDNLIVFCLIPSVILILAVLFLIFVDLSVFFYDLKEKRRLRKKYNKTDG